MRITFRSKSLVLFATILLMAALFTTGCRSDRETVTIAGSTSVQPISEELAVVFFLETGIRVEVMGGGSGAGIRAARAGTADIGATSRDLNPEETGIEAVLVAMDGMAVIVHPENPVDDLSFEDLQRIFRGEITNWREVGGADANIFIVNREAGSGTHGAFREIVIGNDYEFTDTAIILNTTGAIREAVSNSINAIGYISIGGINDSIKTLTINGVGPTIEMIQAGKYPIARPFNYIIVEGAQLSEAAQAFFDFAISEEGQSIIKENGFVPIN